MNFATRKLHFALSVLVAALAISFAAVPASSQPGTVFTINHYLVYNDLVPSSISLPLPLLRLRDQFGESEHHDLIMDHLAFPVDKNNEGIPDPLAHLSWWRLLDGTSNPFREVVVRNQFGDQFLGVFNAEYLLVPALKNPDAAEEPIKDRDHYKCYNVEGDLVPVDVSLAHQFFFGSAEVLNPAYLCNPVEKILPDGTVFKIVKPNEHLVCYQIQAPPLNNVAVLFQDQFIVELANFGEARWICVPSEKEEAVQVEDSTWGELKSIYR